MNEQGNLQVKENMGRTKKLVEYGRESSTYGELPDQTLQLAI